MATKRDAKKKLMSRPLTVEAERPKPKVLTREELHQRIDLWMEWAKSSDSWTPMLIQKWEYDGLLKDKKFSEDFLDLERRRVSGLLSEVSRLKEQLEYAEGKRPLSEIHNGIDRTNIEWKRKCDSGELVAGLRRAGMKAERKKADQQLPKKNDDYLTGEFRAFLQKERANQEGRS